MIDDAADPRLDDFRDLRDPALRRARGLFVAETLVVVRALCASPHHRLRAVLCTPAMHERLRPSLPPGATVYLAAHATLQAVTGLAFHRGCLAVGERGDLPTAADVLRAAGPLAVLLDAVTNPDNVGGIFRSAHAFGAGGIVLSPRCADPLYRKVVRVSVGATLHVPWTIDATWPAAVDAARAAGFAVVALTTRHDARPLHTWAANARTPRCALLLGNEGTGLDADVRRRADVEVTIPIAAGVDSLNVAAAAAIALHAVATRP